MFRLSKLLSIIIFLPAVSFSEVTVNETRTGLENAAKRYVAVAFSDEFFEEFAAKLSKKSPEGVRDVYYKAISKKLDRNAYRNLMHEYAVKNFSIDELNSLTDFISTKNGKSVIAKMDVFINQVEPKLKPLVEKALASAVLELKNSGKIK